MVISKINAFKGEGGSLRPLTSAHDTTTLTIKRLQQPGSTANVTRRPHSVMKYSVQTSLTVGEVQRQGHTTGVGK